MNLKVFLKRKKILKKTEVNQVEQKKLDRINFLAKKAKTEGLTEAERAEQAQLRDEYRAGFMRNLRAQLDNTYIMDADGNKKKLR